MSLEILSPIAQAVATFAGAIFVLLGIGYKDRLENRTRAKNARVQFVAEIRALLDLIELNNYLPSLRKIIEQLQAGGRDVFYFPSSRSFTSVYEANLQNLGLLDGHASEVVRFYMILLSTLEDKETIWGMAKMMREKEEKGIPLELSFLDSLRRRHEGLLAKLSQVVLIGEKICKDLG